MDPQFFSNPMKVRRPPRVGDIVVVYGKRARVFKVHKFGTVDVETLDGKHAWRVSGLGLP